MTPMVFCASFAPWPNETAAADTSWKPLNTGWLSCIFVNRWIPSTRYMAMKAIPNATAGDRMMPMPTYWTPAQPMAAIPTAEKPAPTSPPMMAWLEEEGMPKRQVT